MVQRAAAAVLATALLAAGSGAWAQIGELVDRSRLRVCADPNNLPFSNQAGEGFENKIAELLAESLGVGLQYTWYPGSVGFVRNTLGAIRCDLVIGVVSTTELMQNTNPYYRSSYVLIQRADAEPKVDSLHDVDLEDLRIGVVARTPPATVLARAGLLDHVVPYQLMVDTRFEHPAQQIVADVAAGRIEVGALWGPIAGYWASRQEQALAVVPLSSEVEGERLDFRITMGLRRNEPQWEELLNAFLAEKQSEIEKILLDYGVPLLDARGQLISPEVQGGATPEKKAEAPVEEPEGYRMAEYRAAVPASLRGATVVTTAELEKLIATARPLLIDVLPAPRPPASRPAGSVWRSQPRADLPGSIWLPNVGYGELSAEFDLYFRDNLAQVTGNDPSRPLVFYCEADCWMSWNAAKRALAYGYGMVIWYPEGTEGWRAAGLPLEAAEPVPMPDFLPMPASAAAQGRAD
ncbi:MAG: quinoprotein dehydrogenase-associated putative transporter substrate-binding protein [Geminicoccaceae bacterium]|nr:quinoprotein dehydrogenase-associated putative transporter substrate-binding protein [Geminicoccaceae bacterium]